MLREATMEWFVGYGDADAFGTIAWARYADWVSRANSKLWTLNRDDPPDAGVVRSLTIDYTAPARFEETLTVTARYVQAGRTSFTCEVTFDRPDGERAATATLRMVSIDPSTGGPCEVPSWLHGLR